MKSNASEPQRDYMLSSNPRINKVFEFKHVGVIYLTL